MESHHQNPEFRINAESFHPYNPSPAEPTFLSFLENTGF